MKLINSYLSRLLSATLIAFLILGLILNSNFSGSGKAVAFSPSLLFGSFSLEEYKRCMLHFSNYQVLLN